MIRGLSIGLAMALGWAASRSAASEPAPAAARETPAQAGPDYKVVFWFDGATPRHQAYDVRKGQYTKAVEDWVRRHQRERVDEFGFVHPGAMAVVRDITLKDEPGRTEREKLEAGIARVSRALYAVNPAALGRLLRGNVRDDPFAREPRAGDRGPSRGVPGVGPVRAGDRSYLSRPRPSGFPTPYPYPRPHP